MEEDSSDPDEFTTVTIPFLREVGTSGVVFASMDVSWSPCFYIITLMALYQCFAKAP